MADSNFRLRDPLYRPFSHSILLFKAESFLKWEVPPVILHFRWISGFSEDFPYQPALGPPWLPWSGLQRTSQGACNSWHIPSMPHRAAIPTESARRRAPPNPGRAQVLAFGLRRWGVNQRFVKFPIGMSQTSVAQDL